MIRALVLLAALAAPIPVLAQVATGGPSESTANANPAVYSAPTTGARTTGGSAQTGDPNRRICRKSAPTGTRIANGKVCKSAREWDEQRQAAKAELERHQRPDGTNGG